MFGGSHHLNITTIDSNHTTHSRMTSNLTLITQESQENAKNYLSSKVSYCNGNSHHLCPQYPNKQPTMHWVLKPKALSVLQIMSWISTQRK
jgi:hypothetical protein